MQQTITRCMPSYFPSSCRSNWILLHFSCNDHNLVEHAHSYPASYSLFPLLANACWWKWKYSYSSPTISACGGITGIWGGSWIYAANTRLAPDLWWSKLIDLSQEHHCVEVQIKPQINRPMSNAILADNFTFVVAVLFVVFFVILAVVVTTWSM